MKGPCQSVAVPAGKVQHGVVEEGQTRTTTTTPCCVRSNSPAQSLALA